LTYDITFAGFVGGGDVVLKVLSAAAIVVMTAAGAFAADLPMKAALKAPVAPGFSWTGCFAGVHAGGAFSDDKIRSSGDFSSAGFIGGGQVGCDYQFASPWVVGFEGRAAWSSLNSQTPGSAVSFTGLTIPTHFTVNNDFLASATARVGYSFVGGWLVYGRGGAAWTREKSDIVLTPPLLGFAVDPRATTTRTGWTAGTGLEWAFAPHWSTNLEYDYYDFGSNDFTLTDAVNRVTFTGNLKDRIHTVTVGLNYHF
jgi:outer membrane immunogenic protein